MQHQLILDLANETHSTPIFLRWNSHWIISYICTLYTAKADTSIFFSLFLSNLCYILKNMLKNILVIFSFRGGFKTFFWHFLMSLNAPPPSCRWKNCLSNFLHGWFHLSFLPLYPSFTSYKSIDLKKILRFTFPLQPIH